MRIFSVAFLAGAAIIAANTASEESQKTSGNKATSEIAVQNKEAVDPIITGQTISREEISDWEDKRKRYLECPDCEKKQPFPGE